ncbi:hypothetical protein [Sphingomonas quercus]|uniref:L,D-transpeptidase n=1 Tax=Sphingomonas quercus TaxID=2842451 RepID=A0ABS6BLU2_9SPHN|nr:hypothetical protein [Sphingomonas quercus]MBU3079280.1 hypothetical protein [Sphingomonas quercus]
MKILVLALAGLALTATMPASAAHGPGAPKATAAAKPVAKAKKPPARKAPPVSDLPPPSEDAARVAAWIASSGDNYALPYIIVDKKAATLMLFDAKGRQLGQVPVLIGIAVGDDATPGIGSKNLAEIGPAEKTTPAGRFLARFGLAAGRQQVLWVDYATSVALHPIPTANKKERRRERMLSPTIDDNRITFGCINVPQAFYTTRVSPLFRKKGGYVYVLPDTKSLETVFPPLRVQAVLAGS